MCGHLWRWRDLLEGRLRISNCLTWAKCNVAELCLLLWALAGVPTKLWGLARAGPIPVSSPTRGRAQAPWRPLVPSAVHCNQSRSKFPFQRRSEEASKPTERSIFPPRMSSMWEISVGRPRTNQPQMCKRNIAQFFMLWYQHQVSGTSQSIWNKSLLIDPNFSDFWAKRKGHFLSKRCN